MGTGRRRSFTARAAQLGCVVAILALVLPSTATAASSQDLTSGLWRFTTTDKSANAKVHVRDGSWTPILAGASWTTQGFAGHYGYGWYRTSFVPTSDVLAGPRIQLRIVHGDSYHTDLWTYLNGHFLGVTTQTDHVVDVPRTWLNSTSNVLAVRAACRPDTTFVGVPTMDWPGYEKCGLTGPVTIESSATDRAGIPLQVTTDKPGHVTTPDSPLMVTARVINTTITPASLTVTGNAEVRAVSLEAGQVSLVQFAFQTTQRGPHAFTVTVADAQGTITSQTTTIGVADAPASDDRFGSNVLGGDQIDSALGTDAWNYHSLTARAGAKWLREQSAPWASVEQEPGLRNWGLFDGAAKRARASGVDLSWTPLIAPYWAHGHPAPTFLGDVYFGANGGSAPRSEYFDEFAAWLGEAAGRTPGRHWEIGNEPDHDFMPLYFAPEYADDAKPYTELLCQAANAIRAADPTATMVLAGLAHPEGGVDAQRPDGTFFERIMAAGAGPCFDVMNFHAYSGNVNSSMAEKVALARGVMAEHGIEDRPLWVTETNQAPPDPESSRRMLPRNEIELAAAGVDRIFAFTTIDGSFGAAGEFGMFDMTGHPRPAFFSHQTMTRMLSSLPAAGTIELDGGTAYRFTNGIRDVLAVWDDEGRTVAVPNGMTAFDDYGNPIAGAAVTLGPTVTWFANG